MIYSFCLGKQEKTEENLKAMFHEFSEDFIAQDFDY
jgi:hypothetical protein